MSSRVYTGLFWFESLAHPAGIRILSNPFLLHLKVRYGVTQHFPQTAKSHSVFWINQDLIHVTLNKT